MNLRYEVSYVQSVARRVCDYCGRPNHVANVGCDGCGAPLPLRVSYPPEVLAQLLAPSMELTSQPPPPPGPRAYELSFRPASMSSSVRPSHDVMLNYWHHPDSAIEQALREYMPDHYWVTRSEAEWRLRMAKETEHTTKLMEMMNRPSELMKQLKWKKLNEDWEE